MDGNMERAINPYNMHILIVWNVFLPKNRQTYKHTQSGKTTYTTFSD